MFTSSKDNLYSLSICFNLKSIKSISLVCFHLHMNLAMNLNITGRVALPTHTYTRPC